MCPVSTNHCISFDLGVRIPATNDDWVGVYPDAFDNLSESIYAYMIHRTLTWPRTQVRLPPLGVLRQKYIKRGAGHQSPQPGGVFLSFFTP